MTGVTSTTISSMSMSIPPFDVTPVIILICIVGFKFDKFTQYSFCKRFVNLLVINWSQKRSHIHDSWNMDIGFTVVRGLGQGLK
jgi:hypothetical protein